MIEHGDENGLLWKTAPVVTQRSRGTKPVPRKPSAPDWEPPSEFPAFKQDDRISLDIETFDPDLLSKGPGVRRDGYTCGIGVGIKGHGASYYPTRHSEGPNLDEDKVYGWLAEQARDFKGEIVGANLGYDLDYLAEKGVHFPLAKIRDIQIAEPLLDENRRTYNLQSLGEQYLGEGKVVDELKQLYGDDYIKRMPDLHAGHVAKYVRGDLLMPWQIYEKQKPLLEAQGLTDLFDLESRLVPLLVHMRRVGVRVDVEKAEEVKRGLVSRVAELQDTLQRPVDVWAAESVKRAMDLEGLEYPTTDAGNPSFKKEWLERHSHPLPNTIAQIRSLEKLGSTFVDGYIVNSHVNGRLHCQFNQLRSDQYGTVSGRFSSSNPNLQNIPARDPVTGPLMRGMFLPEEGYLWGSADWSQIEFRFLVHWAMVYGFKSAKAAAQMYRDNPKTDFHEMAAELTGLERGPSKNINFGVVYGMGEKTMAANLGKSIDEARPILRAFHSRLPFIKEIYEQESRFASRDGYITTILGRRRRFEDRSKSHKALNGKLQGSAADLMKKAMVDMWEAGLFTSGPLVPHLTVHDEMDVSVPDTKAGHEAFAEMNNIMETCMKLEVPVLSDAKLGANWSESK